MSDVITLANQIAAEKENIRQAIEDRGVSIPASTPLTDYAAKIMSIDTQNVASDVYLIDENYDSSTTDLLIAGNYGVIADNAFARQQNIQTVDLNYVHAVGNGVFYNCSNLTTVSGNNLKYIGDNAFEDTGLTTFDNTHVKYIGNNAFGNSAVTSVNIPNCEIVKGGAFMQADNLETVNMDLARDIPGECFYGCNILNSVSANSARSIGGFAFYQAGNGAYATYGTTYTLSFPEVQTVGMKSFYQVNGLTSISLPKCVSIGVDSFNNCPQLVTITAPKIQSIESGAFDNANAIYILNIPECTSIGSYNFYNNSHKINELTVANGCVIGDRCFDRGIVKINGKISRLDGYFMGNLSSTGTIEIDMDFSGLTYIGTRCFCNYNSSQYINFKSQVVDLANLTTINISSSDYIFHTGSSGYSNVKKIWLRSDLRGSGNYWSGYRDYSFNAFNNSNCHVYTDAAEKPSNWGNILNNATWHFSATHEEFEVA